MKKTHFNGRGKRVELVFAIAMSNETGCLVMLRDGEVVGSLDREQSIGLADGVLDWDEDETEELTPQQALDG